MYTPAPATSCTPPSPRSLPQKLHRGRWRTTFGLLLRRKIMSSSLPHRAPAGAAVWLAGDGERAFPAVRALRHYSDEGIHQLPADASPRTDTCPVHDPIVCLDSHRTT